jgi:hypothetical protein
MPITRGSPTAVGGHFFGEPDLTSDPERRRSHGYKVLRRTEANEPSRVEATCSLSLHPGSLEGPGGDVGIMSLVARAPLSERNETDEPPHRTSNPALPPEDCPVRVR